MTLPGSLLLLMLAIVSWSPRCFSGLTLLSFNRCLGRMNESARDGDDSQARARNANQVSPCFLSAEAS